MGWLTRKFGLSIDNLVGAEVISADGRILQAAADEHPDLFWALRGGGGNFGVVTSFEFGLHEVDPMVQFAMFFWGLHQGRAALRLAREIVATMPLEINAIVVALNALPAPFVRNSTNSRPATHSCSPDSMGPRITPNWSDPRGPPAAVRHRLPNAVRGVANHVRRGLGLGRLLLREDRLRRRPVRSGDRGGYRARPTQARRCQT